MNRKVLLGVLTAAALAAAGTASYAQPQMVIAEPRHTVHVDAHQKQIADLNLLDPILGVMALPDFVAQLHRELAQDS